MTLVEQLQAFDPIELRKHFLRRVHHVRQFVWGQEPTHESHPPPAV